MQRKIIHVDMDAFYASVEQRDNSALRGMPVAVGHDGGRGVVAAASYEARRFGVRSAMAMAKARRLCPQLVVVPCRFDVYREVSRQIHSIFHEYTDLVEPISLDEAFLDVTVNKPGIELAVTIAREIKLKIWERLHLRASAGVSYNKFLAKVASDYRKPDGLCTIHPSQADKFIASLPVEDFWGVGPVTAQKMHRLGIYTGSDLKGCSESMLTLEFGKAGKVYYDFARGIDNREVEAVRERKSVGCESTFSHDLLSQREIDAELAVIADELLRRLSAKNFQGHTLTLKVKFNDFTQITRSVTEQRMISGSDCIHALASRLAGMLDTDHLPIRLLGLAMSNSHDDVLPPEPYTVQLLLDL